MLRGRIGHLRRQGPAPSPEVARNLDAVLLSHLHYDHLDLPSLRRLGSGVRLVVPCRAAAFLRRAGFPHATELAPGESAEVDGLEIRATTAVHSGRRGPLGPVADAIGFEIRGPRRIYFAGDTDLFPGMADLEGMDVAFLPVWGWGPTLGRGHLDPARAARAAALVRPRLAVPIHWGAFFPLGLGRWRGHLLRQPPGVFAAQVARLAPEVRVAVVEPGETLSL